jgi:shikimate dehydrogenase
VSPPVYELGLLGFPLAHSVSPRLHGAALEASGNQGTYRLYPIDPAALEAQLPPLMERLRSGSLGGLNVTIPHKQAIVPYLDRLSPAASAIGAVNTLYTVGGLLVGENTDAPGFWADVQKLGLPETGLALVLGAGGAARAVVYALRNAGWQVHVAARRLAQAQAVTAHFSPTAGANEHHPLMACALDGNLLEALPHPPDLIVNATPLGMLPDVEGSPWPAGLAFPPAARVYDLVYKPARTRFIAQAQAHRLVATNGLGMLVEQAALAFELWTGEPADREAMFAAVEDYQLEREPL